MDAELKKQWVEALRSGEYEQVRVELRNEKGYCCLGVLTELINPDVDWEDWETRIDYEPVKEALGGLQPSRFWHLNDDLRYSFEEIADWIEEHVDVDA